MSISGECQCPERCGRNARENGPPGMVLSVACGRRWKRAGSPPEGPPAARERITGVCQCAPWCRRPAGAHGPAGVVLSRSCRRRWVKAGSPPQPVPAAQDEPRKEPVPDWDEPDAAEVAARWGWVDPQLRRERAVPAAAALVRCVQMRDRMGVETLLSRYTDWGALAVVLAEWAHPVKMSAELGVARERTAA